MDFVGLIPAAGSGTRLYPFARAIPKELYPFLGKPSIEHCVNCLKLGGVKKTFVIVGHQKGAIMDYLGNGEPYGMNISYIYQMQRKGLGHAILQAKDWIKQPFITLLGDAFIEPKEGVKKVIEKHEREEPLATILVQKVGDPSNYGVVKFDDNGVVSALKEKPSAEEAEEFSVNGGYYTICGTYAFDPRIFDYIEETPPGKRGEVWITDSLIRAVNSGERVYAVVHDGDYIDLGKWKTIFHSKKNALEKAELKKLVKEREEMNDKWSKFHE